MNVTRGDNIAPGRISGATPDAERNLKALKKACEQFEAVFAKQLIGEMRKGVKEIQIGDQSGSAIYKDMMDQAIGDSIAHTGALGIGAMLYREFAAHVAPLTPDRSATLRLDDPAVGSSAAANPLGRPPSIGDEPPASPSQAVKKTNKR